MWEALGVQHVSHGRLVNKRYSYIIESVSTNQILRYNPIFIPIK